MKIGRKIVHVATNHSAKSELELPAESFNEGHSPNRNRYVSSRKLHVRNEARTIKKLFCATDYSQFRYFLYSWHSKYSGLAYSMCQDEACLLFGCNPSKHVVLVSRPFKDRKHETKHFNGQFFNLGVLNIETFYIQHVWPTMPSISRGLGMMVILLT